MKNIFNTFVTTALVSVLLVTGGCKKTPAVNGLIQSYAETDVVNGVTTTSTVSYSYDGQNRLTTLSSTGNQVITLSYGSGSVTETQGSTVTVFTLNSAGQATSDNNGNTYVYDNNGYCTTISNHNAGAKTTINTISNGDISNSAQTVNGNTTNYIYTFLSTTDYRSHGVNFLGKANVNLVNSETVSTTSSTTYTFSYTFDSQGRVQTQTLISGSNSSTIVYTYVN